MTILIRRMRFACCIIKARGTHSEYVIPAAFPHEQWLRERPLNDTPTLTV